MKIRTNRNGFTLWELIVVMVVLAILWLVWPPICATNAREAARATEMKTKGRRIWAAVISANADRCELPRVWPETMGFTVTNTSTEYFRRLLTETNGDLSVGVGSNTLRVPYLKVEMLAGAGVPAAKSIATFSADNNAWSVTCTNCGDYGMQDDAFLISRNLDVGAVLSSASRPAFVSSALEFKHRAVWVTMSGACLDAREKYLSTADLLVPSNCPPVAVMRP